MTQILEDRFGRRVDYLRLSVTDRCDFRCHYCMAEEMKFLPRAQVLSLEELLNVGAAFVALGVTKIRLTGGEPLVRNNVLWLVEQLAGLEGLKTLALTTNASRLAQLAQPLKDAGLTHLNVSVDSLDTQRFKIITRTGDLARVLAGIVAAQAAGFKHIKLNSVILRSQNLSDVVPLVEFALARGLDISFIEEMPLGEVAHLRRDEFVASAELRALINRRFSLEPSSHSTGGPAAYWRVPGQSSHIGFISPHSENFCAACNRVRVTAEGRLLLCLGNEHSVDLKQVLRDEPDELVTRIRAAMQLKPEQHHFDQPDQPQIVRFMNSTGG
ncbi:MAG TPA: GTP 3',8-cyclase MoaA [Cellvibrionaceae bacterium]